MTTTFRPELEITPADEEPIERISFFSRNAEDDFRISRRIFKLYLRGSANDRPLGPPEAGRQP